MFDRWKSVIPIFGVILIISGIWMSCLLSNLILLDRYVSKARKYYLSGQLDKSIEYYKKAIKVKVNSSELYNDIGVAYKHAGKLNEAVICFKKSIEINPKFALPYINLGNICFGLYKLTSVSNWVYEAMDYFRKSIEIDPNSFEAYNGLGLVYGALHQYDRAILDLKRALAINPNFAQAYNNLGNVYSSPEFSSYGEAVVSFKKAIEINPEFAGAYANLAKAYYSLGLPEQSKDSLKIGIKLFEKMGLWEEKNMLENMLKKISE